MGSLMAGWSTKPSAEEEIFKRSTSSLTKEEVEKFWKMKRMLMEEHQQEAQKDVALSPKGIIEKVADETAAKAEAAGLAKSLPEVKSAWWTRSNSAFLNDPPAINPKEHRYVPQFDVALKGQEAQEHPKEHRYVPQFDVVLKGQEAQEHNSVESSPSSA